MTTTVRPLGELGTKLISILLTITLVVSFTPMAYAVEADETGDEAQTEAAAVAVEEANAAEEPALVDDEATPEEVEAAEETVPGFEDTAAATEDEAATDVAEREDEAVVDDEETTVSAEEETTEETPEVEPVDEPAVSLEIPPALTGKGDKAVQAVNGDGFYAVLLNDGSLWMWGDNAYGQIANATEMVVDVPTQVLDDVVAIAAGSAHMVVLKSDGTVWTWGKNDKGQLGDGTLDDSAIPVKMFENAVAVFAKDDASAAQSSDGLYRLWGEFGDDRSVEETGRVFAELPQALLPAQRSDALSLEEDGTVWLEGVCIQFAGLGRTNETKSSNLAFTEHASAEDTEGSVNSESTDGARKEISTDVANADDGIALAIQADTSKTLNFSQANINAVGLQSKVSYACLGFAYAYAQTMTSGKLHYWGEYDLNGGKNQSNFFGKSTTGSFTYATFGNAQATLRKVYDSINDRKPVVLWVTQTNGNQHWVTVVGYRNVSNANSLNTSQFLMLDPVYGSSLGVEALNCRGYSLRYGPNNLRISKAQTPLSPTPTCNAPTFAPFNVIGGKKIRVDNHDDASIRYTLGGKSDPSNSFGTEYKGNWIDIDVASMAVHAIAYKTVNKKVVKSEITRKTFANATTAAPAINSSATATGARVEMSSATKAATIVYTLDGSAPKWDLHNQKPSNGIKYTGAFNVTKNCTIKAIALASGSVASSVTTRALEILPPAKPEIRAAASKVAAGDPIRILWSKDGAAASYSVTFYDGDTAIATKKSESSEVTYIPSAPGTYTARAKAINKVGESEESDPVTVQVMPDCTVRFVDKATNDDGETVIIPLDEQKVKWGYSATKPVSTPKKRGYTFAGWDRALANITEDVDIAAQWEINTYVVRFYSADGSRQLKRQVVEYGKSAEAPEPEAPATGYVFSGWTVTEADADSERDFTKVDSNMKLRAVYAWGDEELPVVAQITQAQRTASGNYTVKVKLTNYPNELTTALLRVALKTSAGKLVQTSRETVELAADGSVEKTVTLKYNGDYVATVAEIEVVGIDGNYRTGGAYSEAATASITSFDDFSYSNWSDWSTTKPTASETVEVESATQYRYRDKQTTTSTATSLSGWTRDGTSNTTYGSWSSNKTTTSKPNEGDTLRITATSTKYNYFHYCNKDSSAVGGWSQDSVKYGSSNLYHTLSTTSKLSARYIADRGGRRDSCTGSKCAYGYTTWWLGSTTTTYTYQTRSKTVTYGYYKWGSWSGYGFDETAASGSREVEKRTVYRSRTKIPNEIKGAEDTSGTKQSVSGTLNTGTDLAGKQATIMVYNVTNSDPNEDQIQYIGQTTIGAGNAYSFEFVPRSDPSAESGDFIVALGVKGATGLVNVDTIKAPRPEYQVTFQYEKEDGAVETVSTQTVAEGDDAELPDAPTREGCRFLGWSTTATRVNDNLVVNALFSPRTCTVVWVDHQSEDAFIETYEYGQKLSAPEEAPSYDGYSFKGWDALLDDSEVAVKDDMVVTAVFEPVEHTVFFANADGSVFKAVKTNHGEAAELPADNPTANGMEFVGWDTSAGTPWWNVMDDMIVKPLFAYENTVSSPFSTAELAEGYVSSAGAKVFLETSTEGAEILYTTDGSEPTAESAVYKADQGIVVKEPTTIRAMAVAAEMNDSSITDIEVNVQATNDIGDAEAGIAEAPFFYGEAVEPGVMVWLGDDLLEYGADYTIEYSNNTAIGTGEALVKGMGDYTGQQVVYFDIVEAPDDEEPASSTDISDAIIYVPDATYTGEGLTPEPVVVLGGKALVTGTDYVVSYSNNTLVGNGTVAIVGIGDYTGIATKTFKINGGASGGSSATEKPDVSASQATVANQTYAGKALTPAVKVVLDGKTLVANTDYTVTYVGNVAVGTASAVVTGKGSYTGSKVVSFKIGKAAISKAKIAKVKAQKYKKGKAAKPNPVVKFNGKKLKKGTDYTITYKNNKKKGTAKLVIKGKGNFKGSKTVKFKIK